MRIAYHPDFPKDIKGYQAQYTDISPQLGARFRHEVDTAIEKIKDSPGSAGHFLNTGSKTSGKFGEQTSFLFRFSSCMALPTICSFFVQ
jgi:hypothetical protein